MTYYTYDFYKYIAPDVPMVPLPTVEDTVADVIIDFCQKTSIYRQWLEDYIAVSQDDEEVELDLPNSTAVVEILAIQEVEDIGDYGDFRNLDDFMFTNQADTPMLLLNDPAEKDYEARVRVALRPTIGFTEVPDFIYEDWRDVIASGAKHRLLAMRGKPWYAPRDAEGHRMDYRRGVQRASSRVVLETINKVNKPTSRYI
ncbi:MAG: hypothetical protein ACLFUE_05705 [Desulfobacteraceae bacterium]